MGEMEQDKHVPRPLDPATTTIDIGVSLRDGNKGIVALPLRELFAAYLTIHEVGFNNAIGLVNLTLGAAGELAEVGAMTGSFAAMLHLLEDRHSPIDVSRKQRERQVLSFCYLLRTRMSLSLTRTAEMAAGLLEDKMDAGYVEAFRKKLERYAEREKKDPPGKPRRKRRNS